MSGCCLTRVPLRGSVIGAFIFSKDVCVWLYCLLAFVEMPLSSGVCGTIRGIYRRLSEYSIDNEELQTCVDVVKVICSRFFNQKF